jgi:hydroxyacylglutathione hydrolase
MKGKPVAHVLGNHIEEMRMPFLDFPIGSIYHPDEHVLDLTFGTLLELEDGLKSMHGKPRRMAMRDFTIWPLLPEDHGLGTHMEDIYKQTQEKQQRDKWDQPK